MLDEKDLRLLVIVDTTQTKNDYEQSKADLASATQALSQAENSARRSQELYSKKLISDQDLDQSRVDLVRAQTQVVRAKAALSTNEDKLRDTRVLAPISGVILSRSVDLGQIISSAVSNVGGGTVLATVADMDEVYVMTNVDEVDIGKGTNLLFISPGAQRGGGVTVIQFGTSVRLKNNDAAALLANVPAAEAIVPEINRQAQVKYQNRNWNTRIVGTVPEYEDVRSFRAVEGRYFTHAEELGVAKVCVIG